MQKKESYKHIFPHFQQPGQAYFVTWCLKDAVPAKVVEKYSKKLEQLKHQIDFCQDRDQNRNMGFISIQKSRLETASPETGSFRLPYKELRI